MLIPLGILASSAGGFTDAYEHIATTTLTSAQSSVTFDSLNSYSSTYKHLQVRWVARTDRSPFSQDNLRISFNGVTTNTPYDSHYLMGEGAGRSIGSYADVGDDTGSSQLARLTAVGSQTGAFAAGVIDILDPYSTTKNKTTKSFSGQESQDNSGFGGRFIIFASVLYNSTNITNSIGFLPRFGSNFVSGSRFSIYGIKG